MLQECNFATQLGNFETFRATKASKETKIYKKSKKGQNKHAI